MEEKTSGNMLPEYFRELDKQVLLAFPDLPKSEDGKRILELIHRITTQTRIAKS